MKEPMFDTTDAENCSADTLEMLKLCPKGIFIKGDFTLEDQKLVLAKTEISQAMQGLIKVKRECGDQTHKLGQALQHLIDYQEEKTKPKIKSLCPHANLRSGLYHYDEMNNKRSYTFACSDCDNMVAMTQAMPPGHRE